MLQGATSTGFEYEIEDWRLDNMELLDALAEADKGNLLAFSVVCDLLFGKEQKKKLYDHVRTEKGTVPSEKLSAELLDIIRGTNPESDGKN